MRAPAGLSNMQPHQAYVLPLSTKAWQRQNASRQFKCQLFRYKDSIIGSGSAYHWRTTIAMSSAYGFFLNAQLAVWKIAVGIPICDRNNIYLAPWFYLLEILLFPHNNHSVSPKCPKIVEISSEYVT